jgi:hypothetical protein
MERECLYCGTLFAAKPKTKEKYYCSDKCRSSHFYANRDRLPLSPKRTSKCEYCGNEFDNRNNPGRKYCCHAHYTAVRFGTTPPEVEKCVAERTERLPLTMELKSEGVKKIAKGFGMSPNAVKNWIKQCRDEYLQDDDCAADIPQEIEIRELPQTGIRRIFLLCGTARFTGKYDNFVTQIPQTLSENLMCGDAFVFCSKSRYQLSVLQWQGDGFVLMFRRTEQERYPRPFFTGLKVVEITRQDLEMLPEYPRFVQRLKGLATPEFLI